MAGTLVFDAIYISLSILSQFSIYLDAIIIILIIKAAKSVEKSILKFFWYIYHQCANLQEQVSGAALQRWYYKKVFSKIWSKVTGELPCRSVISIRLQSNVIQTTPRLGCSPVNVLHIFRALFPKNTYGKGLLLNNEKHGVIIFMREVTRSNQK